MPMLLSVIDPQAKDLNAAISSSINTLRKQSAQSNFSQELRLILTHNHTRAFTNNLLHPKLCFYAAGKFS